MMLLRVPTAWAYGLRHVPDHVQAVSADRKMASPEMELGFQYGNDGIFSKAVLSRQFISGPCNL